MHNELKKILGGSWISIGSINKAIDYLNKCKQKDIQETFTEYETLLYPKNNYISIHFGGDMLKVWWSIK